MTNYTEVSTSSAATVGDTVVTNVAIFCAFVVAFLILRERFKNVYIPRDITQTVSDEERPRPLAPGVWRWVIDLFTRTDAEIIRDAGLDAYFFLRYLRFCLITCIVGIVMLFPILLSVNGTGGNGDTGFDLLAFGNVKNHKRYFAHVFLSWAFFGYILFALYRETIYYVAVRQAVLTSPAYKNRLSSRAVLLTTVPDTFMNEEALASIFDGVKYVVLNRKYNKLEDKVQERDKLVAKVEAAEVSLLKTAVKNRLKSEKKRDKAEKKAAKKDPSATVVLPNTIDGSQLESYVPEKKWPTHRLKFLIGKKVKTIDYAKEEVPKLNEEIREMRANLGDFALHNSAFVIFDTQEQAEVAVQVVSHHLALHMSPKYIGVRPDDIIWSNMRLFWWERLIRGTAAAAFLTVLIIFWSVPVAFVGFLSNITSLIHTFPWLKFLLNLPKFLQGLVTGLLPTVLLAILMMLLPIVIRLMAKIAGRPTKLLVEYYTQNTYFAFQVVHVFIMTTLTSGLVATYSEIERDPYKALTLLSDNLPKASNFYLAYFMLQGFTIAGGALLQITTLILFYVFSILLDGTPRKKWNRHNILGLTGWGTTFPVYTNLAVILISYSIISPLILCFGLVTFALVYMAYLYIYIFVQKPTEGRGIFYYRAIQQTFVGLYIAEVCLLGLFIVAKAWGCVVLEAILIGVTVFVHVNLKTAFSPLQLYLPRNLLRYGEKLEQDYRLRMQEQQAQLELDGTFDAEVDPTQPSMKNEGTSSEYPEHKTDEKSFGDENTYSVEKNASIYRPSASSIDRHPASSSGILQGSADLDEVESGTNIKKPAAHLRITKHVRHPTKQAKSFGHYLARYFRPYLFLTPQQLYEHLLESPNFHRLFEGLSKDEEKSAYENPCVTSENPVVWIPRDPWGLADIQVEELRKHDINASDSGTWFEINETKKKSAIVYGDNIDEIPIWSQPPRY